MPLRILLFAVVLGCFSATVAAGDPPGEFTGRVVDRAGEGVPNATVVVHWRHLDGWDLYHAECDATGRFTVAGVRHGRYIVSARTTDGRVGMASAHCVVDQTGADVLIEVVKPRMIRVRVADSENRPLKGAKLHKVELTGPNGRIVLSSLSIKALGLDVVRSDEAGLLEVGGLPAVGSIIAEVAHPEFVHSEPVEASPDAAEPPTASLSHGGLLVVSIRQDGAEIPDEGLRLNLSGERRYFVNEPFAEGDRDGRYQFTVPFGTWSGIVRGDGVQTLPALFENVVVAKGKPGHVEIVLTPRGVVRGRVIDQETGEPAANEVVSAAVHSDEHGGDPYGWGAGWFHSAHAITDDDGWFTITPGVGKVRLWSRKSAAGARIVEPEKIEVDVPPDRTVEVEPFRLLPPVQASGVVLDPSGNPVPHAIVKPVGKQQHLFASIADEHGRFSFEVEEFDRSETDECAGTLSLRVFDPHRPLESKATVPVDLRTSGESLMVRLKPQPIATHPGVVDDDPSYVTIRQGIAAPELAGQVTLNADGPIRLSDLRGKYVLLDFWTVWCGPCRLQKSELEAAARIYGDQLVVIGVHDKSVSAKSITADVRAHGPSFPTIVDAVDGGTVRDYGVDGYPSYVLIGPDGRVLLTSGHNSPAMHSDLLSTLRSFLHGPPRVEPVEAGKP